MLIEKYKIQESNDQFAKDHSRKFEFIASSINNVESILQKLVDFQIAIPSWALGAGGTRFGRFSIGGEPRNLEEKIEDVGLLHKLNQSSGARSTWRSSQWAKRAACAARAASREPRGNANDSANSSKRTT